MAGWNSVHVEGTVKRDAEANHLRSGVDVMEFSIAVQDPVVEDMMVYVDCFASTDAVAMLDGFVTKGERLAVDGALTFRTMTSPRGVRKSGMMVYVENVEEIGD